MILSKSKKAVLRARKDIQDFEKVLSKNEDAVFGDAFPLKHTFAPGVYVREMFIPAGSLVVGKIHKMEHVVILLSGTIQVVTETGNETLKGPITIVSDIGKKAVHAITDCVWINVHPNPSDTKDLKKIENQLIAKDYNEFDTPAQFFIKKLFSTLKKLFIEN